MPEVDVKFIPPTPDFSKTNLTPYQFMQAYDSFLRTALANGYISAQEAQDLIDTAYNTIKKALSGTENGEWLINHLEYFERQVDPGQNTWVVLYDWELYVSESRTRTLPRMNELGVSDSIMGYDVAVAPWAYGQEALDLGYDVDSATYKKLFQYGQDYQNNFFAAPKIAEREAANAEEAAKQKASYEKNFYARMAAWNDIQEKQFEEQNRAQKWQDFYAMQAKTAGALKQRTQAPPAEQVVTAAQRATEGGRGPNFQEWKASQMGQTASQWLEEGGRQIRQQWAEALTWPTWEQATNDLERQLAYWTRISMGEDPTKYEKVWVTDTGEGRPEVSPGHYENQPILDKSQYTPEEWLRMQAKDRLEYLQKQHEHMMGFVTEWDVSDKGTRWWAQGPTQEEKASGEFNEFVAGGEAPPKPKPAETTWAGPTTAEDPLKTYLERYPWMEEWLKMSPRKRGFYPQYTAPAARWFVPSA